MQVLVSPFTIFKLLVPVQVFMENPWRVSWWYSYRAAFPF